MKKLTNRLLRWSTVVLIFGLTGLTTQAQNMPDSAAGQADQEPGYNYEDPSKCKDIVSGTPYYYLQNDSLFVSLSPKDGQNSGPHSMHRGVPMDIIPKGSGWDNLDWAQLALNGSLHGDYDVSSQNPNLDSFWLGDQRKSVYASGYNAKYPNIRFVLHYSFLNDTLPILKMKVRLINEDTTDFNGFLQYQLDPDGTDQKAWAAGIGSTPGLVYSGWTSNYIYCGLEGSGASQYPGHGIAWLVDQPVALLGYSYITGAWFNAEVAAGDTSAITLYHIAKAPNDTNRYAKPQDAVGQYAENLFGYDTSLSNRYRQVTGRVEDVHGKAVANAEVEIKNLQAETIAEINTGDSGYYSTFIPRDVYTATVTSLGYQQKSRSIDANKKGVLNFTVSEGFALTPINVWAGTGKSIGNAASGYVTTNEQDIVMENDQIAVGISKANLEGQIRNASKGVPVDMIVKGDNTDYLDWLNMNHLSFQNDTTESWWKNTHVMNDTVYVESVSTNQATVVAEGRYFRRNQQGTPIKSNEVKETHYGEELVFRTDIVVNTEYSIKPGDQFISVETRIQNDGQSPVQLWAGDILDIDGDGQTSYVPGIGNVTGDWGLSEDYTFRPNAPWFAQFVSDLPVIGLIYEGNYADSMKEYGVRRWMSSKQQISIAPQQTYTWNRKVVANSAKGYTTKPDAIADVYSDIKQQKTGLAYELEYNDTVRKVGDTLRLGIRFNNSTDSPMNGVQVSIHAVSNIALVQQNPFTVDDIPANGNKTVEFRLVAKSAGRGINDITITDVAQNTYESSFLTSIIGTGWYAGDNHTHSVHSDGSGTIAENVQAAYNKGMSFITATDHNTHSQAGDVKKQNAEYKDMIVMTGEEVTTSRGHALAYNTGKLIPWKLNQYTHQEIIDSTNNTSTQYGSGFMYLAHPHYPGLPWRNYSVRGQTGLEVWNGFYHATHPVNQQTFDDWDSLNNMGLHLYGISNSDAHNPSVVAKNYIMAYLDEFTKEEIIKVMRDEGHYYGTNGPRLDFRVEGRLMGSDVKVPRKGRKVSINLMARSNNDETIDYVRIIKNGNRIKNWTPQNSKELTKTLEIEAMPGDFIRMELKSGTGFAYSNPVWFEKGSSNARIAKVIINGAEYEPFDTAVHEYIYAERVNSQPSIEVIPADTNAEVNIKLPADVNDTAKAKRTATISITSEAGGTTKQYAILFNKDASSIANQRAINSLKVFPSPAKDRIHIVTGDPTVSHYMLLSMKGRTMKSGKLKDQRANINVKDLPGGVYIIQVSRDNGIVKRKKIIINQ